MSRPLRPLRTLFGAFVGLYLLLDSIFAPLFRPLARLLRHFPPLIWMEIGVAKLPPYGALVALGVPFLVAEPAKILGLFVMGDGKPVRGVLIIVGAYIISLVVVDRIYEAGRPALMRIGWFARLMGLLIELRDQMVAYVRATRVWREGRAMIERLKRSVRRA